MRTIRIFGAQDYIIVIEGGIPSDSGDELNATTHPQLREHGYMGILHISAGESEPGLYIHPIFSGTWSFAVSPDENFEQPPDWPTRRSWGADNEGSETIEIEVPSDAKLTVMPPFPSQPKN